MAASSAAGNRHLSPESWFEELAAFRRSADKFLSSRKIGSDDFITQLLNTLYAEGFDEVGKAHILTLLHEQALVLLNDPSRLDHVVSSLQV